jgi:hypothetical protein
MWGRLTKIVGLVLLVVTVVSVVSPWFDLHPTTLRTHRRAIILILAIPPILQRALPVSSFLLTKPPTLQSQQAYDIVARDCAWLC